MAKAKYKEKAVVAKPKARNDAYTMILFITFLAAVAGCVLLYLDFDEYGQVQPTTAQPLKLPALDGTTAPAAGGAAQPAAGGGAAGVQ